MTVSCMSCENVYRICTVMICLWVSGNMTHCPGGGRGQRNYNESSLTERLSSTEGLAVCRSQLIFFFFFWEMLTWSGPKTKLIVWPPMFSVLDDWSNSLLSVDNCLACFPAFGRFLWNYFNSRLVVMHSAECMHVSSWPNDVNYSTFDSFHDAA